jgi:hypothetical protein
MIEVLLPLKKDTNRIYGQVEREILYFQYKKQCVVCNSDLNWEDLEIHHLNEHQHGGQTTLDNGAQGVITVNSTAGIRALQLGCPVMILGDAIYNIVGMTNQGPLDHYWREPGKPHRELVEAFLKLMAQTILVRGVFFNEPGQSAAVGETVRRLRENKVGVPL